MGAARTLRHGSTPRPSTLLSRAFDVVRPLERPWDSNLEACGLRAVAERLTRARRSPTWCFVSRFVSGVPSSLTRALELRVRLLARAAVLERRGWGQRPLSGLLMLSEERGGSG